MKAWRFSPTLSNSWLFGKVDVPLAYREADAGRHVNIAMRDIKKQQEAYEQYLMAKDTPVMDQLIFGLGGAMRSVVGR
jgi:hypothetical protein